MNRLKNIDLVPPEPHFAYRNPDSGHWSISQTHTDWIAQEYEHRKGNGLEIPPNLRQIMETQLCDSLPPGWCEESDFGRIEPIGRIHRGDVIEGTKVFAKWFFQGRPLVEQAEAERRAGICSTCVYNVQVIGCSSCHKVAEELTGKVRSSLDDKLIACAICKCVLKLKIHFPLETLETVDSDFKQNNYPPQCWLKKTGVNYASKDQESA